MIFLTNVTIEPLEALEAEIKETLNILLDLHLEDAYSEMSKYLAKLLSSLQAANLIDYKLDVLVDPAVFDGETKTLLNSLIEAKSKPNRRHKLLTHRKILKIWLRKNARYTNEFLPQMF